MSVLPTTAVVGANGFIGSRLVEMLHLDGTSRVRPVVRRASALASAARFSLTGRVADATDAAALHEALAGCTGVVHCVSGDAATIVRSAEAAYRAAEAAGCRRLVYLSSASVHGQAPAAGTDERSSLSDRQPLAYNNAKVRAERTLDRLRRKGRLELVVLRPGIVFGPRSVWISGLAEAILAGHAHFVGDDGGICNAVYVDNLVSAIRLALDSPRAAGETYLVGDHSELTWRELYRPVAAAFGVAVETFPILPAPPLPRGPDASLAFALASARIRAALPAPARRIARALRDSLGPRGGARAPLPSAAPVATVEMALLHGCRHRLPWRKLRDELGYAPVVGREEAFRRTLGWLAFAGYPVGRPAPAARGGLSGG